CSPARSSSATRCHASSTTLLSRMTFTPRPSPRPRGSRAVRGFAERLGPDPAVALEKRLVLAASLREVARQHLLDGVGNQALGQCRSEDASERGRVAVVTAEHELVGLLAVLVDAEDADVGDVMVTARVDAAADLDAARPHVLLVVEVVEASRQLEGERDRA